MNGDESMKEATLKALADAGALEDAEYRAHPGGWVLWVRSAGREPEQLENKRGEPRVFKREGTAVSYVRGLGLASIRFELG